MNKENNIMNKEDLRIIFMGTPEFAVGTLSALVENNYNVVAVVTQPDKPVGRHGSTLRAPAVKVYAEEHGIPVMQPQKMKDDDFQQKLKGYNADIQIVVAFRMLPEAVWSMPKYGTFNVHASLLPQYRGAAPINWAIINGEKESGVTTFFLDHEIDTGSIILQKTFDIPIDADVEYVYDGLMKLGAEAALETLDMLIKENGNLSTMPQNNMMIEGTVLKSAPKIYKDTCKIDWSKTSLSVYNFVRGLSPIPGAWTNVLLPKGSNIELKIYKAGLTDIPRGDYAEGELILMKKHCYIACSDKLIELYILQPSGRKRMQAIEFLNGLH